MLVGCIGKYKERKQTQGLIQIKVSIIDEKISVSFLRKTHFLEIFLKPIPKSV